MNNPELKVKWVGLELVHANPWNPNVQSDFMYDKTKISILEHGFVDPIKVRQIGKEYEVIDGEHRWRVANELITRVEENGDDYFIRDDNERIYSVKKEYAEGKIPIINYGDVSDGVARELTIVLNNTRGESDELKLAEVIREIDDLLGKEKRVEMLPYSFKEMDMMLQRLDAKDVIEDDPPPVSEEEPITKYGDLWRLGSHRLLNGDSTCKEDVGRVMDGEEANAVISDPPFGVRDDKWDTFENPEQLLDFTYHWLECSAEVSNLIAVFMADKHVPMLRSASERVGLDYRRALIWMKPPGSQFAGASLDGFWFDFEIIQVFGEPVVTPRQDTRFACLQYRTVSDQEHGCEKPVGLLAELIDAYVGIGCVTFDPFLGSGTTLIACDQLNRECRGLEVSEKYCDVIVKRYIQHVGSSEEVFVERDGNELTWEEAKAASKRKIHVC